MLKPLLILALLSTLAHARIGETPEQCAKRYGELTEQLGTPSRNVRIYAKGGLRTNCYFTADKCVSIGFELIAPVRADFQDTPENRPALGSRLVTALLEANKGETEWIEQAEKDGAIYYTAKDGSRHAFSTRTHLIIQTTADIEFRKSLIQSEAVGKAAEGF